jgi:hypothetical protein
VAGTAQEGTEVKPMFKLWMGAWSVAVAAGVMALSWRAWTVDIPERAFVQRAQLRHVQRFLATDDPKVFERVPRAEMAYYSDRSWRPRAAGNAEPLAGLLRDPAVRRMLPGCVWREKGDM